MFLSTRAGYSFWAVFLEPIYRGTTSKLYNFKAVTHKNLQELL